MKTFSYVSNYDSNIDKEVIELCNVINSLPGLKTLESCCGHNKDTFRIFFTILPYQSNEGLFFLTRCIDRRYWKYGDKWSITLSVADHFDKILPITFLLESKDRGEVVYDQANDLVENMKYHLNHKNFIKCYNIDLSKFSIKENI